MKRITNNVAILGLMILLLGILSCSDDRSPTQPPTGSENGNQTVWQTALGGSNYDNGYAVLATADGAYVVAGGTMSSGHGSWDVYLAKVDADGIVVWEKTYGGLGSEAASAVAVTPDGGFILAGASNSSGAGRLDFYLVKTDADGVLQWDETYGAASDETARSVIVTADGGYAVAGSTQSFDALNYSSAYLVVIDADGTLDWSGHYGGPGQDAAYDLEQTDEGGFILAGHTNTTVGTSNNAYVVKVDARGEVVWAKTYGGPGNDYAHSIAKADDGYVLAGWLGSSNVPNHHGGYDIWGVKIDLDGNLVWQYGYGDAGYDGGESIAACSDGGFVIAGHVGAYDGNPIQAYLVKIDASGQQVWKSRLGQSGSRAAHVSTASDGGFIVVGTATVPGGSDEDIMLIKTDATGKATE